MTAAPLSPQARDRLIRRAAQASVAAAAALIAVKFAAWAATGSVAVLSSLVDSALDAAASIINLVAVRHALAPADREHRFGHGKAESIAGLAQSAFVAGSALYLVFESVSRLASPRAVEHGAAGAAAMLFSIAVTFALVRFQNRVAARTGSTAIAADSLHYKADLLANLAVAVTLALSVRVDLAWLDPVVALAIAGYILRGAWTIMRAALNGLMDRELPDSDRARIAAIAAAHPRVAGVHDLRTRRSGVQPFVQFHIEVDGSMTVLEAHAVSDEVEAEIVAAFPGAEVIIHQDPEGLAEAMPDFARS